MNIVLYPDVCLRQSNVNIDKYLFNKHITDIGNKMLSVMNNSNGVGLAAPQVGINLRMFVTSVLPHNIIANPKWTPIHEDGWSLATEECLSFPNLIVKTKRFNKIHISYQCIRGKVWTMNLRGFAANVFQHETDHLNGILIIDHMRDFSFSEKEMML